MKKVVSSVPRSRFDKYGVHFPTDWDVTYVPEGFSQQQLIELCRESEYLFVCSTDMVSSEVFEQCPKLRLVHVEGVGFNGVDTNAADSHHVTVCNNRAVNNGAVAEHAIAMILCAMRRIALCDRQIKGIGYLPCQMQHRRTGEHELAGKHIGLVGIGAIGKEVAKRLSGWGCRISYYDAFRPTKEVEQELHVDYMDFTDLISQCDIISLHVPLLPTTKDMFSFAQFEKMKPGAYLVNTSRGEIVNQAALADALERGSICGAAIDTLSPEPAPSDHPLLNLSVQAAERITLTPHIGGTTDEAFVRMLTNAIENFNRVEKGDFPLNIVNKP